MGRGTTLLILVCMGVIALSSAAVLVFQLGRPVGEAVSLSLALMCTMIMVQVLLSRARERGQVAEAVDRLEDRLAELDDDVTNLEGRLTGVEHTVPRRTREAIDPLFAEIEVLGTLVKQMAEAMSDIETRLEDQRGLAPPPAMPELAYHPGTAQAYPQMGQPAQPQPAYQPYMPQQQGYAPMSQQPAQPHQHGLASAPMHPSQMHPAQMQPQPGYAPLPPQPMAPAAPASGAPFQQPMAYDVGGATRIEPVLGDQPPQRQEPQADPVMRELIRSALNANRVDLFLQPIVTLPQRRVKYYESLTRLRDAGGQLLEPSVFLPEALRAGFVPRIDNLLLFRSVQVVRRLATRNRDVALFCNIASLSLVDETFFPGFLEFVRANKNFGELLIFEFTQDDVAQMGVVELESLAALAELGFRFSVDQIHDLKMDFRALADRGFRFAKLNADYLIGRRATDHGHIHPADFGDLLGRYGIELIADHVETESQVLELLDADVKMAQGFLFSPPRPVRAEVLQGAPAPAPRKRAAG
ncbi:EAL domain-containing protein [Microvirga tunisiensis]|uniref:EAL domain-containing protein n=1 Tax=Pannonibacter tanglangensis TaxID=2750084 RepID=A0A7X5F3V6_9HYPH|nr:EAL domain-containing protein [Pannonibacter sp. XCT-53]NBN79009.1 EAL domain-containing protein [Pannonibacter sp. XCT-53]